MQYCEGENLMHFLQENPENKKVQTKWKIFKQICEAVNYLHNHGLIHRDIKPHNVFLDENKDARLGDFGLAVKYQPGKNLDESRADQSLESSALMKQQGLTTGQGTPFYAAPEQIAAKKTRYDFSADIYSLGVVLLDMFRKHDIFHHEMVKIHEAAKRGEVEESIAKKMESKTLILIERLISFEPAKRPSIMEVLTSELLP